MSYRYRTLSRSHIRWRWKSTFRCPSRNRIQFTYLSTNTCSITKVKEVGSTDFCIHSSKATERLAKYNWQKLSSFSALWHLYIARSCYIVNLLLRCLRNKLFLFLYVIYFIYILVYRFLPEIYHSTLNERKQCNVHLFLPSRKIS